MHQALSIAGAVASLLLASAYAPQSIQAQSTRLSVLGTHIAPESIEGGNVEVPVRKTAVGSFYDKRTGASKATDLTAKLSGAALRGVAAWVGAALRGNGTPADVEVSRCDTNSRQVQFVQLNQCMMTEFQVGALDAASKNFVTFDARLTPEFAITSTGSGGACPGAVTAATPNWFASNFRVSMSSLATTRVSRIEPFAIRTPNRRPGVQKLPVEMPNLQLTISELDVAGWQAWLDAAAAGNGTEETGSITFLDQSFTTVLGRIDLVGVGITKLTRTFTGTFTVELYVEQMTLTVL